MREMGRNARGEREYKRRKDKERMKKGKEREEIRWKTRVREATRRQ